MLIHGYFEFSQLLYIVFYTSKACKNQNLKTTLKLLYIIDYLLSNHTKLDINLLKNSVLFTKLKLRYGQFKF